ncbi:hypothetical protein EKK97_10915 [Billgrantia tianxiuensis]|uniref:DUF4760 domain-containing protein n=1 Tax=Billgrantia tianxiuensis TaxID=2497861 RepID=A0A6I6SHL1_9GAMM|nr:MULTISPECIES: hypothetical protein [Halomonas]MCE8031916.1 hypothetical protein [Halomonas sp. MCCC 1A11057]QHC50009.1 hypothetical protein EKK97_10915 [Halomonas tianxiuensis]
MDFKYIWPIVGIVLGWLLAGISAGWRGRLERKRVTAKLLTRIIYIYEDLLMLQSITEPLKDISEDWESHEKLRQYVVGKHFLSSGDSLSALDTLIDEYSQYKPLEAVKLRGLMRLITKHKNVKLLGSSREEQKYIFLLSVYEVGLDQCETAIKNSLVRIANSHGLYMWLKIMKFVKEKDKRNQISNSVLDEIYAEYQKNSEQPVSE